MTATKKKILIIDDEEKIRKIYKQILSKAAKDRFEILEAASAREATNILIRQHVDLVLLDINMPEENGKVMFEVIKEYNPQLKVIVASVYPIHEQKHMIIGAIDYFDKSEGPLKLLEKINNTFSQWN